MARKKSPWIDKANIRRSFVKILYLSRGSVCMFDGHARCGGVCSLAGNRRADALAHLRARCVRGRLAGATAVAEPFAEMGAAREGRGRGIELCLCYECSPRYEQASGGMVWRVLALAFACRTGGRRGGRFSKMQRRVGAARLIAASRLFARYANMFAGEGCWGSTPNPAKGIAP